MVKICTFSFNVGINGYVSIYLTFSVLYLFILCMHVLVDTNQGASVKHTEGVGALLFLLVFGDPTYIVSLGSNHSYILSHLPGLIFFTL